MTRVRTSCSSASRLTRTSTLPAIDKKSNCQKCALRNSSTPSIVDASDIHLKNFYSHSHLTCLTNDNITYQADYEHVVEKFAKGFDQYI